MDISLVRGSTTIVLNGTGAAAPLRGARFRGGVTTGEQLVLEVALEGTAAQITSWIEAAGQLLELGRLAYGLPGEDWAFVQVGVSGATWRTPVMAGAIGYSSGGGAATRVGGSQGLTLEVERPDWWEDPSLSSLPLTNINGAGVSVLQLDNHTDAADENLARIAAGAVGGDLKAPAWLRLASATNGLEFLIGQAVTSEVTHGYILDAESGTLGSGVTGAASADAACSNGNYRPLSWSGASAVNLVYWSLNGTNTARYRGRIFRPVLRLRDLIGGSEKFWLWWRLAYDNGSTLETIQDFEGVLCPTDRKLVPCPPMAVPPWPKPPSGWGWEGCCLQLMCQAEASGSHGLNLDFVQMLPTEGYLRLVPIVATVSQTQVTHDAGLGTVMRTSTAMASHAAEGAGLWLAPGVAQTVYVLSQAGGTMDIGTSVNVEVSYRKRKRAL